MMTSDINIKEYDTFGLVCEYTDDRGVPISLEGIDVTADIQSSTLHEALNVTKAIEIGRFTLSRDSEHLPYGQYQVDVLFSTAHNDHRIASETFNVNVNRAITKIRK